MNVGLQMALQDYRRLFGFRKQQEQRQEQPQESPADAAVYGPYYVWPTREAVGQTDVALRKGRRFRVLVAGETPIDRGRTWVRPDGVIRRGEGEGTRPLYYGASFPNFPLGALLARVGGGDWFQVGFLADCVADASGCLFFALNDTPGKYGDNVDADGREVPLIVYVLME